MQSCYSNPHQMAAAAASAAAAAQNGGGSGDPTGPRLPFPINFPAQIPSMAGMSASEIAASLQSMAAASPAKMSSISSVDANANNAMKRKNSVNQERDEMGGWGIDSDDIGSEDDDDDDKEADRSKSVEGSGEEPPRKEPRSESRTSKTCDESAENENGKERSGSEEHKERSASETERSRKRRASENPENSDNVEVKSSKLGGESDDEENVDDDYDICSSRSPPPLMQTEIKVQRPLGLLAQHGLTVKPAGTMLPRNFPPYFNLPGLGPDRRMSADMDSDPESGRGRDSDRESDTEQEILHSREMMQAAAAAAAAAAAGANREDFLHHFERQHQRQDKDHHPGMMSPSEGLDFSNHLSLMDRRFMPSPPPSTSPNALDPSRTPPTSSSSGHHWTFEEQFKQLYEMSPEPKRKEFLDDLFTFMQKRGTPVNRIPIMAKQTLDLYELFRLVVSKGGLVEVINKKLWREITKGLNLPSSITSAAFTLRTQYMKYLYPYECEKLKLSSLAELQSAIDGNRREGRRPGYGYDFSPMPTMMSTPPTPHMNGSSGLRPLNPSRSSTDDDRSMLTGPSIAAAAAAAHTQLRSMAEHDARAMEAATRAMEEVSKRMEEASRAAAMATGVMGTPTTGPGRLLGGGPPLNLGGTKFEDTPPAIKRPPTSIFEDERFFAQMGMHSTHIKLSSRSNGRLEYDSSMVVSMEINGIMYQGVLFAQHPRRI